MLARAGAPVVMIGRAAFVEAAGKNGLLLDTLQFKETVRVEASTELAAARGADVVLFCVKTTDTESTARSLAPLLPSSVAIASSSLASSSLASSSLASSSLASSSATVVSLQNGVDNAGKIRAARIDALSAVV